MWLVSGFASSDRYRLGLWGGVRLIRGGRLMIGVTRTWRSRWAVAPAGVRRARWVCVDRASRRRGRGRGGTRTGRGRSSRCRGVAEPGVCVRRCRSRTARSRTRRSWRSGGSCSAVGWRRWPRSSLVDASWSSCSTSRTTGTGRRSPSRARRRRGPRSDVAGAPVRSVRGVPERRVVRSPDERRSWLPSAEALDLRESERHVPGSTSALSCPWDGCFVSSRARPAGDRGRPARSAPRTVGPRGERRSPCRSA